MPAFNIDGGLLQFVRCPTCLAPAVAVAPEVARQHLADLNAEAKRGGWLDRFSYEQYLSCRRCGTDTSLFAPTTLSALEQTRVVPPCVVERAGR